MSEKKPVDLSSLADKWPSAYVAREKIAEFTGGILTPRYMANQDSLKTGPPRIKIGKKVVYPVTPLIHWMQDRATAG